MARTTGAGADLRRSVRSLGRLGRRCTADAAIAAEEGSDDVFAGLGMAGAEARVGADLNFMLIRT